MGHHPVPTQHITIENSQKTLKQKGSVRHMIYVGEFHHTIDSASRLTVPARFRDAVGGEVILYRATEHCLFLYDSENFQRLTAQLQGSSVTEDERRMQRNLYADCTYATVDRTGRFIIPAEFMQYASLKSDVVILGVGNRMEIWNADVYSEQYGDREAVSKSDYPKIAF